MRISLRGNQVWIEDLTKLQPYQLSQLAYLGFARGENEGACFAQSSEPTALLMRLLDYFSFEQAEYVLSEECSRFVREHNRERDLIAATAASLQAIKDGKGLVAFQEYARSMRGLISRELKEHQLKASYHLYAAKNGANFSVPGSGKTSVVLAVYEKLRCEGRVTMLFVVGPPSCFGPWKAEYTATLGRSPSTTVLAGGNKEARVSAYHRLPTGTDEMYLTTYQTLANDLHDVMFLFNQQGIKVFLVVDEAHYVKQQGGVWADAVLNIGPLAAFKCALTGTPIPNRLVDSFNVFDLLWGKDSIIDARTKAQIIIAEESHLLEKGSSLLKERIRPFFFRVRKVDLGLKDQVFMPPRLVKMNEVEHRLYHAILTRIRSYARSDYLKNIEVVRRLVRGRIMRLRQCISYPRMLLNAIMEYDEDIADSDLAHLILDYDRLESPAKISSLLALVEEMQAKKQKVVIWSGFLESIQLISRTLTRKGYTNKCIYGDVPTENAASGDEETRELIIAAFVSLDSGLDVLVANPAACAESISLHKTCQNAIYYDLSYNCAQYLQSLDRIHRVGGSEEKESYYYFLQCEGTIDLDIKSALDRKSARMAKIIDEDCPIYSLNMFEEDDEELRAYERITRG